MQTRTTHNTYEPRTHGALLPTADTSTPRQVISSLSTIASLGFDGPAAIPYECFGLNGYVARLLFFTVAPLLLALIGTVILRLLVNSDPKELDKNREPDKNAPFCKRSSAIITSIEKRKDEGICEELKFSLLVAAPYLLRFIFLVYPVVTNVAFDYHPCYDMCLSDTDPCPAGESVRYLKADVSITCEGSDYDQLTVLAVFSIVLYPVLLLLVVAGLLWKARADIKSGMPSRLKQQIDFLHREYRPGFYYWEVFEMFRRLVLVGLMLLMWSGSLFQIILGTLLSAFFLLVQVWLCP